MVSSINSDTTVSRLHTKINGNAKSLVKNDVDAQTNAVVFNWVTHHTLPTQPSDEVDAAFVWAAVFDEKLVQPLSGLVRSTAAFGTALACGFSYGTIHEVIKCVPLEQMKDETLFYAFQNCLQIRRPTWAKQLAQILVERDSSCLGALFAQMMSHSMDCMLKHADVMRVFNSENIQRARATLLGLGVAHNYAPFLKWYKDAAGVLAQQPKRDNLPQWDDQAIATWANEVVAQQQKKTLMSLVPHKRTGQKLKM